MRSFQVFYEELVAGGGGPLAPAVRGALWLASMGYGSVVAARNGLFDRKVAGVRRVPVPVVSVGNITTGGTGKTPLVIDIVERLRRFGRRPAVVSRGYRAGPGGRNDETMVIERRAPGTACVAGADRVAAAERAIGEYGADVVVLDDGFQHRRLGRDVDIVVIDATRPFGHGYLLPRGHLREPVGNIARADVAILTRTNQTDVRHLDELKRQLADRMHGKAILTTIHRPEPLRRLGGGAADALPAGAGPAFLLSGIGNPEAFRRMAAELTSRVCGHARFSDHHHYRSEHVAMVCCQAAASGAAFVVTTEKDAVKLEALDREWPLPVWVLGVQIDFRDGGGKIIDAILGDALAAAR